MDNTGIPATDRARLRAARFGVSFTFLAFGLTLGMWFVHIPLVTARLALEPAVLGLALLLIGLSALLSPPLAGIIITRIGSRLACQILTVCLVLWILVPIFAPHIVVLFIGTAVAGIWGGALNVAMNTQASEVEKAYGRPIMSSFHGFFSLGGLAAASVAGVLFAAGWGDGRAALVAAVILAGGAIVAGRFYLTDKERPKATPRGPLFVVPARELFVVALICLLCNVVEGSVGDWSALYLAQERLASSATATTGYAMFALAMTVSRFAGGPVVARLGDRAVVTWGGVLVVVGMAIVLVAPWTTVSAAGFLIVGIGAANVSPVMISVGSRTPGIAPAIGVGMVSSALAAGLLLGPPIIGFLAQGLGLTLALTVIGAFGLVIAFGPYLRPWVGGTPPAPATT
jgi:MFS family permease